MTIKLPNQGNPCPKCYIPMETRINNSIPSQKVLKRNGSCFIQWDFCKNCKHVQHYEKYRVKASEFLKVRKVEFFPKVEDVVAMSDGTYVEPVLYKKPKKKRKKIQKPKVKKRIYAVSQSQTYKERHTEYINSTYWARRKEEWYAKFTKRCWACYVSNNIHLHHVSYERMGFERDDDLVALCNSCHKELHDRYGTKNLVQNTTNFIFDKRKDCGLTPIPDDW